MCYTYDSQSRVTKRTVINLANNTSKDEVFAYDGAGNITYSMADYEGTNFTYDTNNRLTCVCGMPVNYDADGNMLTAYIDCNSEYFSYDSTNRLISAGCNEYTYNVEDVRIRNLCNNTETKFVYNTNARLSQLLVKETAGVITKYVYGLGLIGEETGSDFKIHHYDYRGSTVALTNMLGDVTDTFTYDTYGKLTSRTGITNTLFMYNGRDGVVTEDNGLIYMRARYYSPELRRFINADIIHGEISNAITLNRYAYANGNPVSNIDPFGLSAERGSVDLSNLLSANDIIKLQEIYGYIDNGNQMIDISLEALYLNLKEGVKKAVRPNNIPPGTWKKMIEDDLRRIENTLGPSSKTSLMFEMPSSTLLDISSIILETGVGVYENIQNGESTQEILTDVAIDVGVGALSFGISAMATTAITSAITGATLGSAAPGIGTAVGFVIGLFVGVLADMSKDSLDSIM